MIVRMVLGFCKGLSPGERANYDPEDVLIEVYATLHERDGRWDLARGRYPVFAKTVAARALCDLRDRVRSIHSPRNSRGRLREYAEAADHGALTERQARTRAAVERSHQVAVGLDAAEEEPVSPLPTPEEAALAAEAAELARLRAVDAVLAVTDLQARLLGMLYGLWGTERRTLPEAARIAGITTAEAARQHHLALRALRARVSPVE